MKGITPIISIIVLLLITISLAGAAYVFLSGTMFGYIGQAVSVSGNCVGGTTARVQVTNLGTDPINLTGCTGAGSVTGEEQACADLTLLRTDGGTMDGNFSAAFIAASKGKELDYVVFRDYNCASGTPIRCKYIFKRAGELESVDLIVDCP